MRFGESNLKDGSSGKKGLYVGIGNPGKSRTFRKFQEEHFHFGGNNESRWLYI